MNINIEQIQLVNSHWNLDDLPEPRYSYHRNAFFEIKRWLDEHLAISIQGLRRTGKSVLQQQLSYDFIKNKKIKPLHYLFYSFDNDDFAELLPSEYFYDVLKLYFSRILNQDVQQIKEPVLICIDEIQNIRNWQNVIKQFYDLNENIKFILTGSSSLYLEESSESLVGRIMDFKIPPLCFGEFLDLYGHKNLATISNQQDLFKFYPQKISVEREDLFNQFLLAGGFPEAVLMLQRGKSVAEIQKYLVNSIISKILTKDLKKYFELNYTEQDLSLFRVLCSETGQEVSYKNIAKDVGMSEEKIALHYKTFEKAGLINSILKYHTKMRRTIKAHPKSYVVSPCLAFAYLAYSNIPTGSMIGHIVEGYVYKRLQTLYQSENIYFTKPTRTQEIDYYIPDFKVLAECKYRDHISQSTFELLGKFSRQYKLKPLLFSKDNWGNADIVGVPVSFL